MTDEGNRFVSKEIFTQMTEAKDFIFLGAHLDSTIFAIPVKSYIWFILLLNLVFFAIIFFKPQKIYSFFAKRKIMLFYNGFLIYLFLVFAYDTWLKYLENNQFVPQRPKNIEEAKVLQSSLKFVVWQRN